MKWRCNSVKVPAAVAGHQAAAPTGVLSENACPSQRIPNMPADRLPDNGIDVSDD
jgi:hypothetical protein